MSTSSMPSKPRIVVDERERASGVPEALLQMGAKVDFVQLRVGDYLLSPEICIERKTVNDLISSIYDGRLFVQASELAGSYARPFLIVEGSIIDLHTLARNPKAIYSALASLIGGYNLHLFFTATPEDTASSLLILLEHLTRGRHRGPLIQKVLKSERQGLQQLYLVSALPGVGTRLAARLLEKFKTPRRVFNASIAELARVEGVGWARASKIMKSLTTTYKAEAQMREEQAKLTEVE